MVIMIGFNKSWRFVKKREKWYEKPDRVQKRGRLMSLKVGNFVVCSRRFIAHYYKRKVAKATTTNGPLSG
jgi:hypothetical protein